MSQQVEYNAAEYQARMTEFANRLALNRPDHNLLRGHPREEFPVTGTVPEFAVRQRWERQGLAALDGEKCARQR
jgi:hypothetical protein